ncbi:SCO7613 C-terminal domain-containing membrane protein [Cryobacterium sp. M25]|uniref:SCO7613 C-terminal domain-containing membrane protein n=1 Tax=Cryobacterium sp. M25 TaxID=2048293 RepID=UPI000CE3C963|nr:hypothetical protein [Cryobacterium sp. M25]
MLAVVLVLLDAWALRANDLFGLASADGPAYWGVTLTVCTALFLGWHAVSGLRVASVAGFAVAAPGLGLLVAGLAAGQPDETRLYLGFLGAAVGALLHRFTLPSPAAVPATPAAPDAHTAPAAPAAGAGHRYWPSVDRAPERLALLVLTALALVGAGTTAPFVDEAIVLAPLWTLGAVAVAALLHVLVILPRADAAASYRRFAYGLAALAALAVTTIAPIGAGRAENLTLMLILPILIAAALSLAAELYARRRAVGPTRLAAIWAGVTAAVVAANAAILVVGYAAWPLGVALLSGLAASDEPMEVNVAHNAWALGTLAAVGGLAGLTWALGGILKPRRRVVASLFMGVTVFLVPFIGPLAVVTGLYALLGTLALVVLLLNRRGRLPLGTFRPVIVPFLILAETFGYIISWHSSSTWWIGSVSAILALFVARLLLGRGTAAVGRGILLAGATLLTLVAAVVTPWALTLAAPPSETALIVDGLRALALATALLQLAVSFPAGRILTDTERRWAFWALLAPTVAAVALPVTGLAETLPAGVRAALLLGSPAVAVVPTVILLGAIGIWLRLHVYSGTARIERVVALGAAAPTLLALIWSVRQTTDAPAPVDGIAVATAALLVCALGLVLDTVGARDTASNTQGRTDRLALEAGAGLILVPGTLLTLAAGSPLAWLVLLLVGGTALVTAIAPDGLFGSRSPRRHLGWLALLLGTAGLWVGLNHVGTEAPVPYVLPVAGMLLVLAVLIRRFGRTPRAAAASPAAALLTLAGLLVAIVPLALASASGSPARPIAMAAACGVLLLGSAAARWGPSRSAYLAAAWTSGAIGLLVTSIVQLMRVLGAPGAPDARLECWLFPLAAAAAGAFLIGARTDPATLRPRTIASITLLVLALATVTTAEIAAFTGADMTDDAAVTAVRASVLVLALGVVHVLAAWRLRAPLTMAVGWVAAGLAGFALVSAVGTQATEPFEFVTVPLGLAIVVGQVLAGRARPADTEAPVAVRAGWITAGLALTLLPGAVVGGTGDLLRPVLALTIGGAFAVSGALLLVRPRWESLAWPALGVGALTVVLTAASRIQPLLELAPNGPDTRLEAWLLPSALILAAVGTGLVTVTRRTDEGTGPGRGEATDAPALRLGYVLLVLAIVGVLAAEVAALGYEPLATIRVILLVWTFSALHLAAFWYDDSRLGRMVAWVAIGAGGGAVVAGSAYAAPATVEIVSVPLAIALLATGWLHLDVTPAARSRRWLAPGLLVLLVPSVLLDITESPLWRVVGLGLVATVVIVVGAVRKLQAPFVIGAIVLMLHAVAQLWPWISLAYGAVPWWLWLGVGGVILIVLAARYEQRIANFKAISMTISALR